MSPVLRLRRLAFVLVAALAAPVPGASLADPGKDHGPSWKQEAEPVAETVAGGDPPGHARGHERRLDAAPPVPAVVAPPVVAQEPAAPAAEPEPAPAPAPQPVATPAVAPAPVATPATPAPAPAVSPQVRLAPGRLVPATSPRTAARPASAAPAARSVPSSSAAPSQPVTASRRERPVAERAERSAQAPKARPAPGPVTRVLEFIPGELRLALAALAALGLVLGAAAIAQTVRSRRLERARRALLADVGVLQSALLPELPRVVGGAGVSAAYRPADGLAAGGDFFDAFALDGGRTAVIVGDVSGHGRDVVPLTASVRYGLRAYLEAGLSPRSVLHVASNVLAGQLGDRQVTVAVAVFDPATARLTYACAGHWPPLLLGVDGPLVTACSSPPLGSGLPTGRRQTTVSLPPGAAACFYTDGLLDVVAGGRRLGPDGLRAELERLGPSASADALLAGIVERSSEQPDDMAACMLTPLPGAGAAVAPRVEELEVDAPALSRQRARRFLRACGVAEHEAESALAEAWDVARRAGTAVLSVTAARVAVAEPAAVALRLPAAATAAHRHVA